MIRYSLSNSMSTYIVKEMLFPGGEVGVTLPSSPSYSYGTEIYLSIILKNSNDIMAMLLTVDALRRMYFECKIIAEILYVPYARQDRVCNPGESLSIAVMASLINSCKFSSVTILDPHSDVTPALINNCYIKTQYDIFKDIKTDWSNIWIVAPDAGAYKKCNNFATEVKAAGVITCNKVRELSTGKITGLTCDQDVSEKRLLVLDDICDGGRTFIEVSKLLCKDAKSIELAVTHGIFSKGVKVVSDHFDKVYTTNSFHGDSRPAFPEKGNIKWIDVIF